MPGGTVTERWMPVRRVGLYVPGGLAVYPSSVVMNVVPGPGRRRRVDRGVHAGAEGVRRPAAPDHPRRVRAARRRRGVRRRRRAGGRARRLRRRPTLGIEPVDVITGPGNVYVAAAKRLVRGIVGIDAEAGPTEIAVLADDTADPVHVAADLISQAEHDTLAASVLVTDSAALADAVDAELERQVGAHQAHRPRAHRAVRRAVGHRAGARPRAGPGRRRRLRRRAPRGHHRRRPAAGPSGSATPAASSSARTRRCRWATTAPGSNHVLPTGCTAPARVRAVGAVVPQGRAPRRVRRRRRWPRSRRTSSRWPRPRTCRRTARPSPCGSAGERAAWTRCRCATSCAARCRTAPRSSTCRCTLNINENPYPPGDDVVAGIAAAVADAARGLNRYPDREADALRADLAALPDRRRRASPLDADQVWAANGSNEIMLQLLQAFGGPGRTAVSFAPDLLDVSRVRPRHAHRLGAGPAGRRLRHRPAARPGRARPSTGRRWCCWPRPTTRPAPRCRCPTSRRIVAAAPGMVVVDEAYGEFRRDGVPSALTPAAGPPAPGRHPHHVEGVRPGRRPARLPRRVAGRGRRRAHRPAALPPVGGDAGGGARGAGARRPSCSAAVAELRAERDRTRGLAARQRPAGGRLGRELRAVRDVRRPARGLAGPARPRRAHPRDWSGRLAAGVHRHARRRWRRSAAHWKRYWR